MPAPISFSLHQRLQRFLGLTAMAWGLSEQECRTVLGAPKTGFAISY